ncbi:hypothetical protein L1987_31104 [Smallanthus sonchifolius]|uniref:Uncharacterized protein n=1 Tax=Smallanthus sonchifolius TaxID=185202 RepID=A0ACB9I4G3_9ASTR|nr:hypothetical protein L1987_31104 [Smallanthus sonchifolius]
MDWVVYRVSIFAMVADLVHGLGSRKLWFPCKYFRINSVFLTVISIAMKLPVDLTGSMPGTVDQVAKLGSMAFMCTMMANLLPCLATTDSDDLLSNIAALCVLVITLVVNVCIQIQTGVVSILTYNKDPSITELVSPGRNVISLPISIENYTVLHIIYVTLLLVLLIVHVCSSLALVRSRNIMESKYQQGHKTASKDIQQPSGKLLTVEKLKTYVIKHWIMARSGSLQFIFTASFPTTSASGLICVFVTILHILTISRSIEAMFAKDYDSDYSWSMIVIVIVQFIGVVIGTIVPLSRCFAFFISFQAISFKIMSNHIKFFEVDSYWTQKLYDWKRASIRLPFRSCNLEVVVETLKRLILSFSIFTNLSGFEVFEALTIFYGFQAIRSYLQTWKNGNNGAITRWRWWRRWIRGSVSLRLGLCDWIWW